MTAMTRSHTSRRDRASREGDDGATGSSSSEDASGAAAHEDRQDRIADAHVVRSSAPPTPLRRETTMAKQQLVLSVFPDELAADSAAVALKESDVAHGGAIGILVLDGKGKLKQDKIGSRSTGKGAAIGSVIAVTTTALLGPAVVAGAAVGAMHHKNLGLSDADKARLSVDLNAGKAAVGVMADYETAPAISDRLGQLGGATERHDLSDDALKAAGAVEPAAV